MVFLDSAEHIYFPAGTEQCIVRHRFLEHCVSPWAEEKDAMLSLNSVHLHTSLKAAAPLIYSVNCHCLVHRNTVIPLTHLNIIDKMMYILYAYLQLHLKGLNKILITVYVNILQKKTM